MTFFANAGIAWPKVDETSHEAGKHALKGASHLWQMLAVIEGGEDGKGTSKEKEACISELKAASRLYRKMTDEVGHQLVSLGASEFELAAVRSEVAFIFERFYWRRFGPEMEIKELYWQLIQRLDNLAAEVEMFETTRKKDELAPSAFRMMGQWKSLAILGRVIAVINRREIPTSLR